MSHRLFQRVPAIAGPLVRYGMRYIVGDEIDIHEFIFPSVFDKTIKLIQTVPILTIPSCTTHVLATRRNAPFDNQIEFIKAHAELKTEYKIRCYTPKSTKHRIFINGKWITVKSKRELHAMIAYTIDMSYFYAIDASNGPVAEFMYENVQLHIDNQRTFFTCDMSFKMTQPERLWRVLNIDETRITHTKYHYTELIPDYIVFHNDLVEAIQRVQDVVE